MELGDTEEQILKKRKRIKKLSLLSDEELKKRPKIEEEKNPLVEAEKTETKISGPTTSRGDSIHSEDGTLFIPNQERTKFECSVCHREVKLSSIAIHIKSAVHLKVKNS